MDQIEKVVEAILEGRNLEAELLFKDLLTAEAKRLLEMSGEEESDEEEEDETEDIEEKGDDEVEEEE